MDKILRSISKGMIVTGLVFVLAGIGIILISCYVSVVVFVVSQHNLYLLIGFVATHFIVLFSILFYKEK